MEDSQDGSSGWKRAKDVLNGARVTTQVIIHVGNPLAGPVLQHAHLEPVANPQEIRHELDQEELGHWAELELERRKEEAGQVIRETDSAKQEETRETRPDHQPSKTMGRARHPGR